VAEVVERWFGGVMEFGGLGGEESGGMKEAILRLKMGDFGRWGYEGWA
jgi:hypothetical protein